jgi:hypothetical protein
MVTKMISSQGADTSASPSQQGATSIQETLSAITPMLVAVALLAAYVAISYRLFVEGATLSDVSWERVMTLYAGFEAIVLTAVGFLFGQEVHRARAERAEHQAKDNQQDMLAVTSEASAANLKVQTLKKAILNAGAPGAITAASSDAALERLRLLAQELGD